MDSIASGGRILLVATYVASYPFFFEFVVCNIICIWLGERDRTCNSFRVGLAIFLSITNGNAISVFLGTAN